MSKDNYYFHIGLNALNLPVTLVTSFENSFVLYEIKRKSDQTFITEVQASDRSGNLWVTMHF